MGITLIRNTLWIFGGMVTLVGIIYAILYLKLKDDFDKRYRKKEECDEKMKVAEREHVDFKVYIKEDITELKDDMKSGFASLGDKIDNIMNRVVEKLAK